MAVSLPPKKSILGKILERYRRHVEEEIAVRRSSELEKTHHADCPGLQMGARPLEMIQRYLEEQNIQEKTLIELTHLEIELDVMLRQTRFRKTQLMIEAIKAHYEEKIKQLYPPLPWSRTIKNRSRSKIEKTLSILHMHVMLIGTWGIDGGGDLVVKVIRMLIMAESRGSHEKEKKCSSTLPHMTG
ncbi:hypothetical protein CIPAW_04G038000 [Carya illinoinensis]|uniref:K-box domain-containing protein n=1 Tax=Carya illinoinensis TaxID=32201 RepID=A0A8T1QRQ2_CARIL|nr:hypothetical protein CIPAW_04G038000 [Carya illinoinensis]